LPTYVLGLVNEDGTSSIESIILPQPHTSQEQSLHSGP